MKKLIEMQKRRIRRKKSIRGKISGTAERPRLSIFKSNSFIYMQAIDDFSGITIASVSNKEKENNTIKSTIEGAGKLGEIIGSKLKEKNIEKIIFDRNGYIFHGKVKAAAEGARKAGLIF